MDETTTDIICIKCKKDDSDAPNEIVLCDTCGIGMQSTCLHALFSVIHVMNVAWLMDDDNTLDFWIILLAVTPLSHHLQQ